MLRGLRTSDRLASSYPGKATLDGHRRNSAPHLWRHHPVAVYPVHHCLVGFGGQVGQVNIIDVAVPYRAVIGDHPVADNRRRPEIADDHGPVDISDPE